MSKEAKILELVNYSGFPFQHHCANVINSLEGYEVAHEVPFTFPGSNGPNRGVHGTIDILATHRSKRNNTDMVCFVVEAKKANDKVKNWIFFENKLKNPKWPAFYFEKNEAGGHKGYVSRAMTLPGLGYATPEQYEYYTNAIEVNTTLSAKNTDTTEKVYNSLKQVAHGARGIVNEPKNIEGLDDYRLNQGSIQRNIYIPIVITTANLYAPKFDESKVTKGEILAEEFKLDKAKSWLTYDFALPDYIGYQGTRSDGFRVRLEKLTVIVVNAEHIEEFFKNAYEIYSLEDVPSKE